MGVLERNLTTEPEEWRSRIINDPASIAALTTGMRRIAVIGIKTAQAGGPAHAVPAFLQREGLTIIPVPVYFPDVSEILGEPVHRTLATVDPPADTVLLFRRSGDVAKHLDEILAAAPRVVWMQLGIRDDAVAETLARAGISVVQDQCLMVVGTFNPV